MPRERTKRVGRPGSSVRTDRLAELAVTDAHALIWAATGQVRKLGRHARRLFERVEAGHGTVYVPTMALVEIGEAHRAGRVSFGGPFSDWVRRLFGSGRYQPAELTVEIVLHAERLYQIPERGDRLIAATASAWNCRLITRDPAIAEAAGVEVVW